MSENFPILVACFVAITSLGGMVALLLGRKAKTAEVRVAEAEQLRRFKRTATPSLSELEAERGALPRVGNIIMPKQEGARSRWQSRLYQAGLYRRQAMPLFMALKFLLMILPIVVGVGLSLVGAVSLVNGILVGSFVGLFGNVGPSIWLHYRKNGRQRTVRRALPDALDVIVICMEGGLSLPGALARVASELSQAHPLLAEEMSIVRREIQLGRTTGDALKQFADRFDVEELRSLASVVKQAEKYGASISKALKIHADTLRLKRYQFAEAMAQKAPVKLIFPTVLCIFPALYIVLMGPASVHLMEMLENLKT